MYIDEIREDGKKCFHNPGIYLSPVRRFLSFFFARNKLIDTYTYTSICPGCGALLRVPKSFLRTELKCVYGLIASVLEFILILVAVYAKEFARWFVFGQLLVIPLIVLLTHSISAAILSFSQWDIQQPMNDALLRYYNDPLGHKLRTYGFIMTGIISAMMCPFGCYFHVFLCVLLAIFNILIGVIAKRKHNIKVGLLLVLGDAILLSICFARRSHVLLIISTGMGFALCFLGQYFLIKYLDDRRNMT